MAKKTFNLGGIMDEFTENIDQTRKKQDRAAAAQKKDSSRAKGSAWREGERPCRKTVHLDEELNRLINFVATMKGEKIEDIMYGAISTHMHSEYGGTVEEAMQRLSRQAPGSTEKPAQS